MNRLRLVVAEALRSLGTNISTTVAATMTVLIGMFLLGLFVLLGTWVLSWSDHVKRQLEVKVWFDEHPTNKQVGAVRTYLAQQVSAGTVKEYKFINAAEGLKRARKLYPAFASGVVSNPIPAEYEVTPAHAENVKAVAAAIRSQHFKGLDLSDPKNTPGGVQDGQQTSKRILQVATWIWRVFLVAVIILLVTSTLLIGNTIRLSIFSRRREIEVMKLVGATNWFVRGPFVLEGLICGLVGSLAAIVLLLLGRIGWNAVVSFDKSSSDVRALSFSVMALILIAVGLAVGAVGSGLTMRRFLRV
jgi:cell division transport system permease protein